MLGQVPSVDEIGILTAENPAGVEATSEKNKQLMDDLKKTLRGMKVGYTDVGGSFGGPEKSIFIMNISRDDVTRLGALFDQLAVIWGQKRRDEEDHPFFRFEYIEGNSTKQTRDVSLGDTAIQSRDDFYSEKSGRKFVIPFFDDDYQGATVDLEERRISFVENEIPNTKQAKKIVESINKRAESLKQPGTTTKFKWHHRNIMREEMKTLENIINSL